MSEGSTYPFHSPLVGRERELRELDDALSRALDEQRLASITFIGSRGIGKTRLVDEAIARLVRREPTLRVLRVTARNESSAPYDPVAQLLRTRAALPPDATEADVRVAFSRMIGEVLGGTTSAEFLHVLGAFVGVSYPESPLLAAVDDDPAHRRALQHAVVRRFLELDARARPLFVVIEDLERASDDALSLVRTLIDSIHKAPIVLVTTARPELLVRYPDWSGSSVPGASSSTLPGATPPHHVVYELVPLKPEDAEQMVLHLLAPIADPPEDLVDAAVDVAGGSPALLEQMIRAYVASGTLQRDDEGAWQVHLDRLDDAQLPLSVEDAIAARIAALSPIERKLLEHGSVMGGVFWLGGLVSLGRLEREAPELWGGAEDLAAHYRDLLEGLSDRDYVLALPDSAMQGEREFAFKHNLEREALYRLIHAAEAKRLHLHVAQWLEARIASSARSGSAARRNEEQCEMLAGHFERGGATRRAGWLWLEAADGARARFANLRAIELYERGLGFLGIEDEVRQLDALHDLGDVLQLAGRNEEAISAFQRMRRIAFRLDLRSKGGVAHNRIGRVYRAIGHLDAAMRHLGTGQALFDAASDTRGVASSLDDIGKVHWIRGNYDAAERFFQKGLELRRELGDARSISLSLNNLGLVYQDSGRFDAAREAFDEALGLRREIGDRAGISQTLNNLGSIHQDHGDHARATELFREALEHTRAIGDRMRQAVILTNLGETMYRQGEPSEAIATLRDAEQISATLGDRILEGEILRGLAKAHLLLHDFREARALIDRSIALFEQAKGKAFLAVALRTAGEIEQGADWGGGEAHQRARTLFERSIQLLEELGNEVELGKSCLALASFLELDPDAAIDPIRVAEIQRLRTRAAEIEDRLHVARELPGEATDPSASIDPPASTDPD